MISVSKRTIIASLFAAFLFPALPAVAVDQKPAPAALQQNPGSEIVAKVNGKKITRDDLDTATNNLMPLVTYHQSVRPEKMKEIEKKALTQLINSELIYKYAKDNKLDNVDKKEIDQQVKDLKKRLPKGDTLDKVLQRSNLTLEELRDDFKKDIVVGKVSKSKSEEFKKKAADSVNEAFLRDYYKKNLEKFKEPEKIHLRTILVKADPSGGSRAWNESKKKAEEIIKLIKEGKDFATLARERSEDPFAKDGGDMGWAHKGSLFPEIEEAASKLKPGETAPAPATTIYGYHIVKLEGRKASVQKKFEELNVKNLETELEQKEHKNLWNSWLENLKNTSKVEYFNK